MQAIRMLLQLTNKEMKIVGLKLFVVIGLCFTGLRVKCQELSVDSEMPSITISNVLNYKSSTLSFSEFQGKLIILDFWGTTCSACIDAFPRLDSLQQKYNDKIQIICVNEESNEATSAFFKKHKNIKIPRVPFVTGDSLLNMHFPHNFYPWNVWIDSNRIVRNIIEGYNTNDANISAFTKNGDVKITQLHFIDNYDGDKPMIAQSAAVFVNSVEYYSSISRCIPGASVHSYEGVIEQEKYIHFSRNCRGVLDLLKSVFEEKDRYTFSSKNTFIVNLKDTSKYLAPTDITKFDEWQSENAFDYDLILPISKAVKGYKIMQQDLMRYFDIDGRVEDRTIKCLVLVRLNPNDTTLFDSLKTNAILRNIPQDSLWGVKDVPISTFTGALSSIFAYRGIAEPLVDGTEYLGKVKIFINLTDIQSFSFRKIKDDLRGYGLDIVEKELQHKVLVLSDALN